MIAGFVSAHASLRSASSGMTKRLEFSFRISKLSHELYPCLERRTGRRIFADANWRVPFWPDSGRCFSFRSIVLMPETNRFGAPRFRRLSSEDLPAWSDASRHIGNSHRAGAVERQGRFE